MNSRLFFRIWYYFRIGWGNYFTFIFAAVNTLIVTYYLAIEQISGLKEIFPSFFYYVFLVTSFGIPFLIGIGYIHFKKTGAYKAERDISVESDPYMKRILQNTENILPLYLKMSEAMIKLSQDKKLSEKEITEITQLQDKLAKHIEKKSNSQEFQSRVYDYDEK